MFALFVKLSYWSELPRVDRTLLSILASLKKWPTLPFFTLCSIIDKVILSERFSCLLWFFSKTTIYSITKRQNSKLCPFSVLWKWIFYFLRFKHCAKSDKILHRVYIKCTTCGIPLSFYWQTLRWFFSNCWERPCPGFLILCYGFQTPFVYTVSLTS